MVMESAYCPFHVTFHITMKYINLQKLEIVSQQTYIIMAELSSIHAVYYFLLSTTFMNQ